jgi:broad specificity phosphatase PhoE
MKLILLRHAESEDNSLGILGGNSGSMLTELGRVQAAKAGKSLKLSLSPTKVYSSPRPRCVETTEIVLRALGSDLPIVTTETLREREFGKISGTDISKVDFEMVDGVNSGNEYGIESLEQVQVRVGGFLEQLKSDCQESDVVLIVSHSNPLRYMTAILTGMSFDHVMKSMSLKNAEYSIHDY